MRRRDESGFVLVAVLWVVLVVGLLGSAALAFSLRSVHTSQIDRNRDLALAAADEGADMVGWRMNKLLAWGGGGIVGTGDGLLASLGCVNANFSVTEFTASTLISSGLYSPGLCPTTTWEDAGNGSEFQFQMETDINLTVNGLSLVLGTTIERRVLVTGAHYVGNSIDQQRRLLLTFRLNTSSTNQLFELYRYVECSPVAPGSGTFDSGCPDPGS